MKISLPIILTVAAFTASQGSEFEKSASHVAHLNLISPEPSAVLINYDLSGMAPEIVELNGEQFTSFPLDEESLVLQNGMPLLPAVSRFVVIPPNSAVELSVTEEGAPRSIRATYPPLLTDDPQLGEATLGPNEDGLYPPNLAEITEPVIVRGVRMVRVNIYPIQYNFNTGTYIHHENITAEVVASDGEVINPVTNPIRRGQSKEFLKMMSEFAINGDVISRDDPERDALPEYNGHYLIVVHEGLLRWVAPFIEWRRKAGYKVDIYSVPSNQASADNTILQGIQQRYRAYTEAGEEPFEYMLAIGDRGSYYEMQDQRTVLESPSGAGTFGARHADWLYGCVDGNDQLPDIATGRWPGGDQARVELMVGRTLAYEATPDMDNPEWFTRGGVLSQHWGNSQETAYHVVNPAMVRWGEGILKNLGYDDIRIHEDMNWDQYGRNSGPVFRRLLNDGANVVLARSENYFWCTRNPQRNYFGNDINSNTAFPIRINASGHGEWSAEMEYRTGDGDHLKGWVNLTNSWNGPITGISTSLWGDVVSAVMVHRLPMGWGYSYAEAHIEQHLPTMAANQILLGRTDYNHFGDPGLKVWFGVPRVVEIEAPESVSPKASLVEAFVHVPDSDEPVAGATVTLYAQGNVPAADNAGYATYSRYWIKNGRTDENGMVHFVIESTDTLFNNTNLFLTVTGDDIAPCFHQARIEGLDSDLEVDSYEMAELSGNGNDDLNPGEQFALSIVARNNGDGAANGIVAHVTSLSPWVTVEDDNVTSFGDLDAGSTVEGDRTIAIDISSSCPDAVARPIAMSKLLVEFTDGDVIWRSAISLDVKAPHLEFRSVVGGDEVPDSASSINVVVANVGRVNSGATNVQLYGSGQGVMVVDGNSSLPAIAPGRTAQLNGGSFDISGNKVVVPGSRSGLYMVFETELGFIDTSYFTVQVMHPRAGAPIGPDSYGYICFDNTDTTWDIAPEYEWVEINPDENDAEFDGETLNIARQSTRDIGSSAVVPLGFTTQFYGQPYDTITVTSNGFLSMGNLPRMTNHHNYPLDQCVGGTGMVAPFWDDLRFGQNSNIYIYRDEENSRFIVEWYRMRPANGNADQTFQVILYDSRVWITESGDQNILFQYKTIENLPNIRGNDAVDVSNNPYASVGICSPVGYSGINYTARNEYPVGAASLAARRAILFTTSVRFRAGILYGRVKDVATDLGIEGATVFTKHGFVATTDADGYWRIAEALADILFDITAHKQGYNDSTYLVADDSLLVPEGDSLEINFDLLHPEFSPTTFDINAILDPERETQIGFSVTNTGNGPLEWSARKRLIGDADAAPWEVRRQYNISQIVDDDRIEGAIFAQDKFFLSGANDADENQIYVLDRDGALLDSFPQIESSRYGYKDMDWDGNYIWAAGEGSILALTTDGEVAMRFADPLRPSQYIACDRENGILYLSGTTTNIIKVDYDGNVLGDPLNRLALRIYGLGYWPEDLDGDYLYIVNRPGGSTSLVTKMNTETNDTTTIFEFAQEEGANGQQSAWITNEFDVYSWVLMTVQNISSNGGGDRLQIHQLDARKDWMDLNVWSGHLETFETQEFIVDLNSAGLPDTLFQGEMYFTHNADSGIAHISIALEVIGEREPNPFGLQLPADGDTLTAYPLHGDELHLPAISFAWQKAIDPNFDDTVITYVHRLSSGDISVGLSVSDTIHTLNLDTLGLALWFDRPIEWWVQAISGEDTVECTSHFSLNILPNDIDSKQPIPVEFGLASMFPNPFNGRTSIRFGADLATRTSLVAYDLNGREVARLFDAVPDIGYHTLSWNADALPTGIYVVRLESAGRSRVAKLTLIK